MKTRLLLAGLVLSQMICSAGDKPVQNKEHRWNANYSRDVAPRASNDPRLALEDVRQGDGHLVGVFALARPREATVAQLMIQGRLSKSGDFTPNVTLEVSHQQNGNWTTVESSAANAVDLTLTGAPDVEALYVPVQLDVLQPYIGKLKFCRVTLSTGDSAVFPMARLTEEGGEAERLGEKDQQANTSRKSDRARRPVAMRSAPKPISDPQNQEVTWSAVDEKAYRRVLKSKLFVTRADCARLSVRSSSRPELALSVYSKRRHRSVPRPSYYVTLTEASKNIFRSVQDKSVMTISIGRQTAKIPTDAAVALRELWRKLLTAANPSDAPPEFSVSGEAMEFSLDALPNPVSVDEIPALAKDETQMLERLRDLLTKYSTAELRERRVLAKKIKKNARDLSNKL